MQFSESIFAVRFGITQQDLEGYLAEALSAGGDYADLYFEYIATSSISMDEGMVKSATQGVSMGVGVRVIAGERTGYAYCDDLAPEKIRKAARTGRAHRHRPRQGGEVRVSARAASAQPLPGAQSPQRDRASTSGSSWSSAATAPPAPTIRASSRCRRCFADSLRHVLVATSDGTLSFDRQPLARFSVAALARQKAGHAAARLRGRRRTGGARLLPQREDPRILREGSRPAGHRASSTRCRRRPAR